MINIWNITKEYEVKGQAVRIIEEIDFKVEDGIFFAIVGTSGCGKSTLLRIVAGLERATSGKILCGGEIVIGPGAERGMVFQDHALLPWRTVLKNVELGLELRPIGKAERRERARRCLNLVGLGDHLGKYPCELSGGMKRRVALARTFVTNPNVLLMDEPFAALDAQTKMEMQKELLNIWLIDKPIVLFVTHDVDEAIFLADRICVLSSSPGRIKSIVNNPLPRANDGSRDRKTSEFMEMEDRLMAMIDKGW